MKLDEAQRHSPSQTAYRYSLDGDLLLWTRGQCPERHTAAGGVVLDYMQLLVEQPAKDWRPVGDHTVRLDLVERLRAAIAHGRYVTPAKVAATVDAFLRKESC